MREEMRDNYTFLFGLKFILFCESHGIVLTLLWQLLDSENELKRQRVNVKHPKRCICDVDSTSYATDE